MYVNTSIQSHKGVIPGHVRKTEKLYALATCIKCVRDIVIASVRLSAVLLFPPKPLDRIQSSLVCSFLT